MREIVFESASFPQLDMISGLPLSHQVKNEAGEIVTEPLPRVPVYVFVRRLLRAQKARDFFPKGDVFTLVETALRFPPEMADGARVTLAEETWAGLCALARDGGELPAEALYSAAPVVQAILDADNLNPPPCQR